MTCAPALSTASTSSPSRAKSADRMEGAIQGVCMTSVYAACPFPSEPGRLLRVHIHENRLISGSHRRVSGTCFSAEQPRRSNGATRVLGGVTRDGLQAPCAQQAEKVRNRAPVPQPHGRCSGAAAWHRTRRGYCEVLEKKAHDLPELRRPEARVTAD